MKAISLWQPWATLMALGLKNIETRSWPTKYQGALLIHASLKMNRSLLAISGPIKEALSQRGFTSIADLPRGGIIGKVELIGCLKITEHNTPTEPELSFGDYTPGRYAWICANAKPFKKIIPYRGYQGLFNVPDEVLRVCRVCGCSEFNACEDGCHWVEEDLCSACVGQG